MGTIRKLKKTTASDAVDPDSNGTAAIRTSTATIVSDETERHISSGAGTGGLTNQPCTVTAPSNASREICAAACCCSCIENEDESDQ